MPGKPIPGKPIINQFEDQLTASQLAPLSVKLYSEVVRRMAAWVQENFGIDPLTQPESIKGNMFQQWVVSRSEKSESTRHIDFTATRRFVKFLYDGDFVQKDMSAIFPRIKANFKEDDPDLAESPKVYDPDDIQKLLSMKTKNTSASLRDRALAALIVLTGLRSSEVVSLNVGDIRNCNGNTIIVKRKGGKRARVTVPDIAFTFLSEYLESRPDAKDEDPLFLTQYGNRMTRFTVYQQLSPKQKALGKATGGHALRHTFTTDAARVGGIATAMVLDNHSSTAITRRYIHASDADRASIVNNTAIAKALEAAAK